MMLAKMALVSILRKLKFERAPDTEVSLHACALYNKLCVELGGRGSL